MEGKVVIVTGSKSGIARARAEPIILVQNVIEVKDQMTFKVLLANWWSLAPKWGAIEVP